MVFVMLFFPLVMNATQYYIIDGFIKKKESPVADVVPGLEDADEHGAAVYEERPSDEIVDSDAEDGEGKKPLIKRSPSLTQRRKVSSKIKTHDYDPERDGENSPTVVGSGSSSEINPGTPRSTNPDEQKNGQDDH